jgi:hypothetical protein
MRSMTSRRCCLGLCLIGPCSYDSTVPCLRKRGKDDASLSVCRSYMVLVTKSSPMLSFPTRHQESDTYVRNNSLICLESWQHTVKKIERFLIFHYSIIILSYCRGAWTQPSWDFIWVDWIIVELEIDPILVKHQPAPAELCSILSVDS